MAATKQATLAPQHCPLCQSALSTQAGGGQSCDVCGLLYGLGEQWDGGAEGSSVIVLEAHPETIVQKCRAGAGSDCYHILDHNDQPICPRVDAKPRRQVPKNTLFNDFEVCKTCANRAPFDVFDGRGR
jgi:hypothetical protein